jgi:hypothetical protein
MLAFGTQVCGFEHSDVRVTASVINERYAKNTPRGVGSALRRQKYCDVDWNILLCICTCTMN